MKSKPNLNQAQVWICLCSQSCNNAVSCTRKPEQANRDTSEAAILYKEIDQFLTTYANQTNYWEIVNRSLTTAILKAHPSLAAVTITLKVSPNHKEPYARSTTVTSSSDGKIVESWSFITAQVFVPHHGGRQLNLTAQYRYRDGIPDSKYPNFVPIHQQIKEFLQTYPNNSASWETVNCDLTNMLLKDNPTMQSFTSRLEVLPTRVSPYRYFTTLTMNQ